MTELADIVINNYFKTLNEKERIGFRQKVLEMTGMGYTTFYNKISGKFNFTKSERLVISQLIPQEYVQAD